MSPASFTPEQDLHFVLCVLRSSGQAYVETDPMEADASSIVRNLLRGQYDRPVSAECRGRLGAGRVAAHRR